MPQINLARASLLLLETCGVLLGLSSPAGAEEVSVPLAPASWEGCVVEDGAAWLAERVIIQGSGRPIVLEAEEAARVVFQKKKTRTVKQEGAKGRTVQLPWGPQDDPEASAGKYIDWVDYAEYRFRVTEPGRYVRWVRYAVPGPSFYHKESIDDEKPFWDLEEPGDQPRLAWQWKPAEVRLYAPRRRVYYELERGEHVLKFHTYYNGARLDKILLTKDADYRPEGPGPPATSKVTPSQGWVTYGQLEPPRLRSWGRLEADIDLKGGKVRFQYSADCGRQYHDLPSNGKFPRHIRSGKQKASSLRLRAMLDRAPDGNSPTIRRARVSFTPDPAGVITLENQAVVLRFDRQTGKLLGMAHQLHGTVTPPWIPSSLFTVSLKKPNRPEIRVLDHDSARLESVREKGRGGPRQVEFDYALEEGRVRLKLTVILGTGEETRWAASLENHLEAEDVIRLKFPILEGVGIGHSSRDDRLVMPHHAGRIVNNPSASSEISIKYEGSASMCWEDVSDADAGVYLAAYDPRLLNTAIVCRPSKAAGRVDLWLEKCHRVRARGGRITYEYAVALHQGDWHRGADLYRAWFYSTMGHAEHADWLKKADGWLAFAIMNYGAPFSALPEWYDTARWNGMNLLQCWGQANRPLGNCCPTYYYPSPFFGTVEDFSAANKAIREAGGHVGYYFHSNALNRFNLSTPWIHTEIDRTQIPTYLQPPSYEFWFRNALVGPDGKWPGPPNFDYFYKQKKAGHHTNDFPKVFPWSEEWQNYLEFWTVWQYAAQWHVDSFYFDVLGVTNARESFNPIRDQNGEGLWGQGMLNLVKNTLEKAKPYAPEGPIASGEGCGDSYGRYAIHMVSGFNRDPEIFRYTLPDQIFIAGHSNTGHATPRAVFEKAHLYGMRFDYFMRGAWPREMIFFRKQFKSWLYPARFLDEEGLTVADPNVQAKLYLLDDEEGRGVLVTLLNPGQVEGVCLEVSRSVLDSLSSAFVFRMWKAPAALKVEKFQGNFRFRAPADRISAALLVERVAEGRALLAAARLETRPPSLGAAAVTVCNLSPTRRKVPVRLLDDAGLGRKQDPAELELGPGEARTRRIELGDINRIQEHKYLELEAGQGASLRKLELPVAAILTGGTFETRPAGGRSERSFIDDKNAASGQKSLCLVNPVGGHLAGSWFIQVKPSTRYCIRMKVKRTGKSGTYAAVYVAVGDQRQKGLKPFGGYRGGPLGHWQEFSTEFVTPADIYAVRLYAYNRLKGAKTWYDDILVEELDSTESARKD